MRFQVILNREGGTLRTLDLDRFSEEVRLTLEKAGHHVSIEIVGGDEIEAALDAAVQSDCDAIMIGGGDGTVSGAAGKLMDSDKALAILPAGTMNLFARSLGIPLDLQEAVAAFADGEMQAVDLATAGNKVFVHQFSVGLHPRMIHLREKRAFRSRLGKMWASVRAGFETLLQLKRLRIVIDADGKRRQLSTLGVGISNNLFGEGHLPYSDTPDGGVLGIYVTRVRRPMELLKMSIGMARGRWKENDAVDVSQAKEVTLTLLSTPDHFGCAIDGELCPLEKTTTLRIHPEALNVIVPAVVKPV